MKKLSIKDFNFSKLNCKFGDSPGFQLILKIRHFYFNKISYLINYFFLNY